MKRKTKVLFLLEEANNNVFAYFPDEVYLTSKDYKGAFIDFKTCYCHVGQHSACHPDLAKECKQAEFSEYQDLLKELINIGYNLEIMNDQ